MYTPNGNDDPAAQDTRRFANRLEGKFTPHVAVVTVDAEEEKYQRGDEHHYHPGAFHELGNGEYQHDDEGQDCSKTVDNQLGFPLAVITDDATSLDDFLILVQVSRPPPAYCHAGLRQGEG